MSDAITCSLVEVHIERGRDVLTTAVPKHEVDVLRAVHGPMNVREGDVTDDTMDLPDSADAEYARLQRKYKRINSTDPVGIAYRMGPRALEEFGFQMNRGPREAAPQSGVRKHKKPAAEKKSASK